MKGRRTVTGTNAANRRNKNLTFENNTPFRSCISKINNTIVDNVEDLDILMPMYNLSEHSGNYSMTSGSVWNYYSDEVNDTANKSNNVSNCKIKNNKTTTSKSFEYKTELIGSTPNNNSRLIAQFVVSLNYLNNFWRSLHLSLINYEIELGFTWSKSCVISEISRTPEVEGANLADATLTIGATFQINNTRIYVPVVTLSINDIIKFLENLKPRFKRTISWNNYRSALTT